MRTQGAALSDMLFGQTRGRILATLYDKPETGFYVRQLARLMGGSVGTVQRELATLTNAGLICRTEGEKQVFYRANRDHPAFAELRALLAKTTGVFHLLRDALETFTDRIEFAFVYGSFARREENAASDVDLMVVGEVAFDDLLEQLEVLPAPPMRRIELFRGGPVDAGRGFVLHTTDWTGDGSLQVDGRVALTASLEVLKAIADGGGPAQGLLALGYAAWGPGQLDREMQQNVWLSAPAPSVDLLFDGHHDTKWRRAMAILRVDPILLSDVAGHA